MIRILHILFISLMGTLAMGGPQSTLASDNTVLGVGAGASLTPDAHENTLLGYNAGAAIIAGDANTLVGSQAGENTTACCSTMVGSNAGVNNTRGMDHAFFGAGAGGSTTIGQKNTYLGSWAGYSNQTGYRNVFVGYRAGYNELGANKLYIANSDTSGALLYGEFDNHLVGINGALGVGTQIPLDQLHVRDGNVRIEQTGATHATLNFIANGKTWEIKNNQATGRLTFFSPGGGGRTASFKFDRQATENLLRVGVLAANTVDINGNLVVTGTITPDYVFTPEYELESIEDHAAYMWAHRHLPAVGSGQVNAQGQAMINVGRLSQGMLEELEKVHIYIAQLQRAMTQNEAELPALKADNADIGKQLAALTRDATATDTRLGHAQTQIAQLQDEMTEKDAQLETLNGEVTDLKALVQQLMGYDRHADPGKEG